MPELLTAGVEPQSWVADRWVKHGDSRSIVSQFAGRSTWNQLSAPQQGLNIVAMYSLAGALAAEGLPQWLDATRLAWRMAVLKRDLRSLAQIATVLCQLGKGAQLDAPIHGFVERSFVLARALCKAAHWVVGEHVLNAAWARELRNRGDHAGFRRAMQELDKPRVLREMLSQEASACERFQVVHSLVLFELERSASDSRLDWTLGLFAELAADLDAGSTAMRVQLIDTELAVKHRHFDRAYVGALQLSHHMASNHSELCYRADLAMLLRRVVSVFSPGVLDKLTALACADLCPALSATAQELHSLARDLDRICASLPAGVRASLPRLARSDKPVATGSSGVVLSFPLC